MSLPTNVSDTVRRLNPQLFGTTEQVQRAIKDTISAFTTPKKMIRQRQGDGMNKTERAFFEKLKREFPEDTVIPHGITLKIANGCRYTPDFIRLSAGGPVWCYEVKGFMRDDAAVKVKVAAAIFPTFRFSLVTRKRGQWEFQSILP